jgi:Centromere DNA-binding protein complex CBF3 subunit, domain 2
MNPTGTNGANGIFSMARLVPERRFIVNLTLTILALIKQPAKCIGNYMVPLILQWRATMFSIHCQRGVVVWMADGDGVESDQIAQASEWKCQGALYQHYLIGLPTRFLACASVYKSWKDQDHLRFQLRVKVPPPKLWQKLFPFVKEVAANPCSWIGHNNTLLGFLEVCNFAVQYYVQDLAVMYNEMYPHQVFSTSLFMSHEFFKFWEELLVEMEKQPDEVELLEPGSALMKKIIVFRHD